MSTEELLAIAREALQIIATQSSSWRMRKIAMDALKQTETQP